MPTVEFTVASAADDGQIHRDGTTWPPTGAFTAFDVTENYARNHKGSGATYDTDVALFRWDTSSIPDNATIVSATFWPTADSRSNNDPFPWSVVGDYYDFGGEPSDSGDWTFECSPSIFTAVQIDSIASTGVALNWPLTDLSGINKSGYTGIRCSLNNSINTPGSNNINSVGFRTVENVLGGAAVLEVTYYVGTPVTFTVASAGDDGSEWRDGGSWPPTGSYHTDDDELAYAAKGNTYANVALFRWDTSSIPDGATITEAIVAPEMHYVNDPGPNYSLVGDYYDFGGEPSVAADWTLECSPSIFTAIDLSTLDAIPNDTQLAIQLTDLSGINKSGYTGIRFSLDGAGVTPTGDNAVVFWTYDHGSSFAAELFVAYTEAGSSQQLDAHYVTGAGLW